MVKTQPIAVEPALRERLLDRLGLALDVARTARRLRNETPAELELRGLSHAEFEWIHAYLRAHGTRAGHAEPVYRFTVESRRDNVVCLGTRSRDSATLSNRATFANK
ncbi:hypothetical protein [Pseudomonas typographi]|uniref:Uncharacterized protein n=1 Tax=Pseudomonas typographi TaxID=2715964 RepID=A0ABR7Z6K7_9PSED|nr:hypothetical protein [Pseudomonas typographi]MBD1553480.1 hypothetical protein [Pseudomonas typographi]MBD1588983.1 hypothetical protein [Pseudomonas typographi]MBD1600954.1 hypothetical protein [Pseudomonas typographi]